MTKRQSIVEGFICPTCMVNLATSSSLQDHWIRFHSSFQLGRRSQVSEACFKERAAFVQFPGTGHFSKSQTTDDLNKQKHNRFCTGGGNKVCVSSLWACTIWEILFTVSISITQIFLHKCWIPNYVMECATVPSFLLEAYWRLWDSSTFDITANLITASKPHNS